MDRGDVDDSTDEGEGDSSPDATDTETEEPASS
jgi:hypothetical protein